MALVNDATEALSATDCGVERDHGRVVVVGWSVAAAVVLVGSVSVEVVWSRHGLCHHLVFRDR